ncbi:DUF3833 domain-containing protein [Denitromonas iodatirespirans]|uniref:DUF3833 domain-containing protein n=1 Tax=Denitromonas iodatirespirans TaxID=2795389 RepID=A0A944DDF8_DENI1|nr:DUF3833 domain-containing protein [Denitromonas iodatirespirans]MBT0962458.1 DUF3833 domain-containing protein [Denitromonas iodatirespirans]
MRQWLCALIGAIGLVGCAGTDVSRYAAQSPPLVLEDYFNGTLDAWGMFQKRGGEVVRRFHVVIEASWDGPVGTLDERFTYDDGETQRRVWTLRALGNGRYTGTAGDVVGEAEGRVAGNAFHWRYVLALPVDGKVYELDVDDWMYLVDDRVMLNRSEIRKFGIRLGEVTLSFRKREAAR